MKKNNRQIRKTKELLPFHVIKDASEGEVEALQKVLDHYKEYIRKLSTKIVYDENGEAYYYIDEELRTRLEIRLITMTLRFRIDKV